MRVAVIGRGLIGSAAGKYLALAGHNVTIFGPDEPARRRDHRGVFGSHHDEGRITRQLDPVSFWSDVSRASIARYRDIERESGIPFFTEAGALIVGPGGGEVERNLGKVAAAADLTVDRLDAAAMSARLPFLRVDPGEVGYLEGTLAGHISPRSLIRAQVEIACRHGATVDTREVTGVGQDGAIEIGGESASFDRVLLAAGCYSEELAPIPLQMTRLARTILFAEIDEAEAERLARMPSTIIASGYESNYYLLPPIRYPDGRIYLKIGGGDRSNEILVGRNDLNRWFGGDGDPAHAENLRLALLDRLPGLRVDRWISWPCVVTFTQTDLPIIERVSDRLGIATGGCGRAAKNSDELGRMATEMLMAVS